MTTLREILDQRTGKVGLRDLYRSLATTLSRKLSKADKVTHARRRSSRRTQPLALGRAASPHANHRVRACC